jgi:transposase-like protein
MRRKWDSDLKAKVIDLYEKEELTTYEVAEKLGLARTGVEEVVRNAGVSRGHSGAVKLAIAKGTFKSNLPDAKRLGSLPNARRLGRTSSRQEGDRAKWGDGYIAVYLPNHPRANKQGYVKEHVLVWEKVHNKSLPESCVIHHINGIKDDNRPCNLVALPVKGHHNQLVNQELKKRIRELEVENEQLRTALEKSQMTFYFNDN